MPKPTDMQSIILSRAATRAGNLALPLPNGLAGAAAKMAITKMLERGWIQEVAVNPRLGEPRWRETSDGQGITLVATKAGLEAVGIEAIVAKTVTKPRVPKPPTPSLSVMGAAEGTVAKPVAIRSDTKQAQIIALLERPEGASIGEIVALTGWAQHTARGMISGALKKKLGLEIVATADAVRGRIYHSLSSR